MQVQADTLIAKTDDQMAAWSGVLALSLGAFVLVASEFMPVSLLTPVAAGLQVSAGQAGQAIALSGAFAVLTSLFISSVAARIDRKRLLQILTGLMIVSGTLSAIAPNYPLFMTGRALIGIAIGGFWSMSAATAMRLVPPDQVSKALAIVNGGNALATVVAAPLGSFLGSIIGWRGAFFAVVPVAVLAFILQSFSLPPLKAASSAQSRSLLALLREPVVVLGMAAVALFFMGQFTLFTYLRPFLETVTQVDLRSLSLILLLIGVAGLVGTAMIGAFIKKNIYPALIAFPLIMAVIGLLLITFGGNVKVATVALGLWGFFATSAPVAWWTWLAKTLPEDAEAGGALMVAVVQLAIMSGAALGGALFDAIGYRGTFGASAAILVAAALAAAISMRISRM